MLGEVLGEVVGDELGAGETVGAVGLDEEVGSCDDDSLFSTEVGIAEMLGLDGP